jgi:hypothetical protein
LDQIWCEFEFQTSFKPSVLFSLCFRESNSLCDQQKVFVLGFPYFAVITNVILFIFVGPETIALDPTFESFTLLKPGLMKHGFPIGAH